MNLHRTLAIIFLLLLEGCAATMHPDYQKVFYKQNVPPQQIEEVMRHFGNNGLPDAKIAIDALGRLQLSGSYENEKEVELAFSIARGVVGDNAVSNVRPEIIKQKDWEISASKAFAKFIEELARKFNMSVQVEQSGPDNLINVSDAGIDGLEQFASNSAEPTSKAAQFYHEMAVGIANTASEETRAKRILIVGHTDDTGDTRHNAVLSEQRAHAVGRIFELAGISSDRIYYQGAGEYLPAADNRTEEGRAKNRRVEIVDLSNEDAFRLYLESRRPNTGFYRPADTTVSTTKAANKARVVVSTATKPKPASGKKDGPQQISKGAQAAQTENTSTLLASLPPKLQRGFIDFGGSAATPANMSVNLGEAVKAKRRFFTLISEAQAIEIQSISSCNMDRPRNAGAVKSLKDGKGYTTNEYFPGLFGRSWQDTVNGNLIMLNGVAVLRYGATPANAPNLKVYAKYNPSQNRNPKPDVVMNPEVNIYLGSNGLLYRVFTKGDHGMQCMDVLMPWDGSPVAKAGKVIYGDTGSEFVSDFRPSMIP